MVGRPAPTSAHGLKLTELGLSMGWVSKRGAVHLAITHVVHAILHLHCISNHKQGKQSRLAMSMFGRPSRT